MSKGFSAGSETTIVAVAISAVYHRSGDGELNYRSSDWDEHGKITYCLKHRQQPQCSS